MPKSNRTLVFNLILLVTGMVMLTFASVPLYRLFCQVTGFGGTPVTADTIPAQPSDRTLAIRFNADTDPNLPWKFVPEQSSVRARIGEQKLVSYLAQNTSDQPVTGHAVYNVLPEKAAPYFAKLECFCFQNQTLAPKQEVHMPISFFIDPAIMDDPEMKDVNTITLSYTFFLAKE